jgi:membrane protease YdiL (CAAX protease family)
MPLTHAGPPPEPSEQVLPAETREGLSAGLTPPLLNMPPGAPADIVPPPPTVQLAPTPPHPGFWWSLIWCVFFLLVTQIPGAFVFVFVYAVVGLIESGGSLDQLLRITDSRSLFQTRAASVAMFACMAVTEVLVIGVSWLVTRLVVGRDWPRQMGVRRPGITHLILVLVSFPAMLILSNGLYVLIHDILHIPSFGDLGTGGMDEVLKLAASWPWFLGVLVIGVGPGIGEELWCRGFLGRGLVGRHGPILGVLMTSFYFGLIHLDPAQGLAVMGMALWLHFVYLTSRSLWMPVLLHFMNNGLAVVLTGLAVGKELDEASFPAAMFGAAAVLLGAVAWALYQSRARLVDMGDGPIWRPDFPGVAHPPQGSGTRVARPWPSWLALLLVVLAVAQFAAVWYWLENAGKMGS